MMKTRLTLALAGLLFSAAFSTPLQANPPEKHFQAYSTEPTDNPLKTKMGLPLRDGGFQREGFHLWDPSIIKVGDTYHLFASCWTSEKFYAWKTSFIVRATSKNLLGPYTFAGEVFHPRLGNFFDSEGCHNPKIAFHAGKYYLYHLGIPAWKSGVAVSDSVEGT
jgi:beta-xylosidase